MNPMLLKTSMQNHTIVPCTRVMVVGLRRVRLCCPPLELYQFLHAFITYRQLWTIESTFATEQC